MPITSHHIIRRHYLHVDLNGTESDGLALQRGLPGLCQQWLTPAIEQVLERRAPPEEHLYFERIEIDAGTLTLERLERDLPEAVAQALEKSLGEHIAPGEPSPLINSSNIQHRTAQRAIQEAFIYFLRTGSLPWSFRIPAGRTLEQAVCDSWEEATKSGIDPIAATEDMLSMLASATVRRRLIQQFSPEFFEILLSLLSPELKKEVNLIIQSLRRTDALPMETRRFEQYLWETAFAAAASGKVSTSKDLVGEAWRTLSVTETGHEGLKDVLNSHWPGVTIKAPARKRKITEPMPPRGIEPGPPTTTETISSFTAGTEKLLMDISEHLEAREGIYIENAGLVILHPFLRHLFEALGIAAGDRLLQPERALCLLHFLTTGQTLAPEYELVLPKILCNVPLMTPVASEVPLTTAEQEEGSALLNAVIRHWEAIRNTSPDGLRGTFLIRPGKVSLLEGGDWLLQVEPNSVDILLDQLPWGISMIKLPWMERMLWVEWR